MSSTPVAGVELLQAHFVEHSFERHSHEEWSIGVTFAGKQTFRCRGTTTTSRSGNLIVFRPDEMHDGHGEDDDGFRYAMLYLPAPRVDEWLSESGTSRRCPAFRQALINDLESARLLASAVGALTHANEALMGETALCQATLRIFSRHGNHLPSAVRERPSAAWLARVRDHLNAHYAENVTVDDLARVAQVSRVHLTRAYTQVFGVPPHVYLNSLRLRSAKSLIRLGTPISQVATSVGFADQSHLTRRFKGSFGITPDAWFKQISR